MFRIETALGSMMRSSAGVSAPSRTAAIAS
jgi:hypothetical protein